MKKESVLDFIIRNRYIIICVSIALVLVFTGVVKVLLEVALTLGLLIGAVYLGKRIQEDENYISRIFKRKKDEVTYTVKDDESKEK